MKKKIKHTPVLTNFIYPEITEEHLNFGRVGSPIREDGNWKDYVPNGELQNKDGVESSACFVEAQQHTIATILEEEFNLPNQNYSGRFNALLSGGTPSGGSPIDGAQSITNDGLIPDSLLPFENINSWDEFHSWKGASEGACKAEGKKWLRFWKPNYYISSRRSDSLKTKYTKLRESLKYSPVSMSVTAWYEQNGIYVKPEGLDDNHLVECVYVDKNNHAYVWDTYEPYLKKLEKNFNFDFAMYWVVRKLDPKRSFLSSLLLKIKSLII